MHIQATVLLCLVTSLTHAGPIVPRQLPGNYDPGNFSLDSAGPEIVKPIVEFDPRDVVDSPRQVAENDDLEELAVRLNKAIAARQGASGGGGSVVGAVQTEPARIENAIFARQSQGAGGGGGGSVGVGGGGGGGSVGVGGGGGGGSRRVGMVAVETEPARIENAIAARQSQGGGGGGGSAGGGGGGGSGVARAAVETEQAQIDAVVRRAGSAIAAIQTEQAQVDNIDRRAGSAVAAVTQRSENDDIARRAGSAIAAVTQQAQIDNAIAARQQSAPGGSGAVMNAITARQQSPGGPGDESANIAARQSGRPRQSGVADLAARQSGRPRQSGVADLAARQSGGGPIASAVASIAARQSGRPRQSGVADLAARQSGRPRQSGVADLAARQSGGGPIASAVASIAARQSAVQPVASAVASIVDRQIRPGPIADAPGGPNDKRFVERDGNDTITRRAPDAPWPVNNLVLTERAGNDDQIADAPGGPNDLILTERQSNNGTAPPWHNELIDAEPGTLTRRDIEAEAVESDQQSVQPEVARVARDSQRSVSYRSAIAAIRAAHEAASASIHAQATSSTAELVARESAAGTLKADGFHQRRAKVNREEEAARRNLNNDGAVPLVEAEA